MKTKVKKKYFSDSLRGLNAMDTFIDCLGRRYIDDGRDYDTGRFFVRYFA